MAGSIFGSVPPIFRPLRRIRNGRQSWSRKVLNRLHSSEICGEVTVDDEADNEGREKQDNKDEKAERSTRKFVEIEKSRTIPLGVRVKVLSGDNFRCTSCGKSPVSDIGAKLHIDRVVPFSKGGTNEPSNLQTLCNEAI